MAEPSSSYRWVEQLNTSSSWQLAPPKPIAAFAKPAPWTADCLLLHGKLTHPRSIRVLPRRHTMVTGCLHD